MPFQKGASGNPGGRPRRNAEITEKCLLGCPGLVDRMFEIAHGDDVPNAIRAANILFERALGRPAVAPAFDEDADEQVTPPAGAMEEQLIDQLAQLSPEDRAILRELAGRVPRRS